MVFKSLLTTPGTMFFTFLASKYEVTHEPLSDDEDDIVEEMQAPVVNHNRGRRTSVSAESMAPSSEKEYIVKYF